MRSFPLFVLLIVLICGCNVQKLSSIVSDSEKDLVPEGIAVNPSNGNFFISSINRQKIISIDPAGKATDFIKTGQHGFLQGLGMKPDEKRNWLWAISGIKDGKWYTSQVHAFDIKTGQPKQHHIIRDTVPHLLNDLVIASDGNIYVTDTYYSAVFIINPDSNKFSLLIKTTDLDYPNGICEGTNGNLYIATYEHGVMQYEIATKRLLPLAGYRDTSFAKGLDGLVYWNNSLIGVYNIGGDKSKDAVIQYFLDKAGRKIINELVLDKGNALFHEPTTLATYNDKLCVLANSHLGAYNSNKESVKGIENKLSSVAIVQYNLKK